LGGSLPYRQRGTREVQTTAAGLPKQSWSVEFWDENGDSQNAAPLDLPAESDWVLYAPNNFEPVLMHNPLIYELSNEIGRYAPRTRFVAVYINTLDGALSSADYNGIYVLEEKIKIGKDRVNIDKLEPENSTPPSVSGGYLLKIDRPGPGESGFNAAGQNIVYVEPQESEIKTPERAPQMPAFHLVEPGYGGITLINIGIGPSNARNVTDHVAVLRPHAWLMVGHCAGLRNTQRLGDYVLAHGYVREDHVLDHELPLWVPIPALAEMQVALEEAVGLRLAVTSTDALCPFATRTLTPRPREREMPSASSRGAAPAVHRIFSPFDVI
jgi:hypothetical protein